MITIIHIAGGSMALIAGAGALCAPKGGKMHRKSGLLFVLAMLVLSVSAFPMAYLAEKPTSLMGGMLTLYLVLTSFLAVRRAPRRFDWVNIASATSAVSIAFVFVMLGLDAVGSPSGTVDGLPPEPMFLFAVVAALGGVGDLRVIFSPELPRSHRIARHLWRMCFALLMAVVSFFFGQAQIIPEAMRIPALLSLFPVAVIGLMVYWLLRVWWIAWRHAAFRFPKSAGI